MDTDKKKVNKNLLSEGLYSKFLLRLIYNKGFNYKFLNKFFKTYINYCTIVSNRTFSRICINPHKKSYLKFSNKQKKKIKCENDVIKTDNNEIISDTNINGNNV